jgi:hypothetical protein
LVKQFDNLLGTVEEIVLCKFFYSKGCITYHGHTCMIRTRECSGASSRTTVVTHAHSI